MEQVTCGGCSALLPGKQHIEHTSPGGIKYRKVQMCETCKLLYGNLLTRIQDSLREGRELIKKLR